MLPVIVGQIERRQGNTRHRVATWTHPCSTPRQSRSGSVAAKHAKPCVFADATVHPLPAALTGGVDDSRTSRWMDLGRGFFLRLPDRGLMTSSMSTISLSCFFLRYSFLMYSRLAFSSSFFCCSASAFNLDECKTKISSVTAHQNSSFGYLKPGNSAIDWHIVRK